MPAIIPLGRLSGGQARVTEVAEPFDISLNSVSKHYLSLDPKPLDELAEWLSKSRDFWTSRLDALETVLKRTRK